MKESHVHFNKLPNIYRTKSCTVYVISVYYLILIPSSLTISPVSIARRS